MYKYQITSACRVGEHASATLRSDAADEGAEVIAVEVVALEIGVPTDVAVAAWEQKQMFTFANGDISGASSIHVEASCGNTDLFKMQSQRLDVFGQSLQPRFKILNF